MAKAKKEFKARVRKLEKHITRLFELVDPTFEDQEVRTYTQETLLTMEASLSCLEKALSARPIESVPADREGPRPIAN